MDWDDNDIRMAKIIAAAILLFFAIFVTAVTICWLGDNNENVQITRACYQTGHTVKECQP